MSNAGTIKNGVGPSTITINAARTLPNQSFEGKFIDTKTNDAATGVTQTKSDDNSKNVSATIGSSAEITNSGAIVGNATVNALGAASLIAPAGFGALQTAAASASKTINIGLIGCGGRGSGAANDTLTANANVRIVAMADIDLAKAKLTVDRMIDPQIDIAATVAQLDAMALQIKTTLPAGASSRA
jgi:hypothetical protein